MHHLTPQVGGFVGATTCGHPPTAARLYLIDSKPIPLCHSVRQGRVRLLRNEGAYFGKTGKGWFFGFKLHPLRHIGRRVLNRILTPGNWDDREPALALVQSVDGGVTIGDLGYRGPDCAARLAEDAQMLLITRDQVPTHKSLLSQVWQKFIDRVFSRSWHGLWNTIQLKVLHYNLVHGGVLSA